MNALFSGMVSEDDGVTSVSHITHIIIPAFVSALSALRPRYPYPPDPSIYEGNYSVVDQAFKFNITVATDSGQLTLNGLVHSVGLDYLAYQEPYKFQVHELHTNFQTVCYLS